MTREEAIDALRTIIIYSENDGYTDKAREALKMAIKALQERKTGRWIVHAEKEEIYDNVCECNLCGGEVIGTYDCCPCCGNPMEVDE